MNVTLKLNNVRLAFSDGLTEAKTIAGGKPRFGATLILEDEATRKQVEDAVKQIAKEEFGGKVPVGKDCAFREGNLNTNKEDVVYTGFADKWYISANRAEHLGPPLILDNKKDPATGAPRIIKDKLDTKFPEAGDYVNAKVSFFSLNGRNDKKSNASFGKKICCQVEVVQFYAKGEAFGAGRPTADGFDECEGPDDSDLM